MKTTLAILAFSLSFNSFACSMPLPATAMVTNLGRVLESEGFKAELRNQQGRDYSVQLKRISFSETVDVELSNGCTIKSKLQWENPVAPGMCPRFKGVKAKAVCK